MSPQHLGDLQRGIPPMAELNLNRKRFQMNDLNEQELLPFGIQVRGMKSWQEICRYRLHELVVELFRHVLRSTVRYRTP